MRLLGEVISSPFLIVGSTTTFQYIDLHINNCTALSVKILDNVPYVRFTRIFSSSLVQLII
jgi:hypothetical protein